MEEQIDLTDILILLWKKKIVIIAVTLVFAMVAFLKFGVIDSPKVEEQKKVENHYAQTTFTVDGVNIVINKSNGELPIVVSKKEDVTEQFASTCKQIIISKTNLNNVIKKLNLNITVQELHDFIEISSVGKSGVMSITVKNTDESQAIKIADELLNEFIQSISNMKTVNQIVVIDKAHILSGADLAGISASTEVVKPNVTKKVVIVALVGFVLSVGGVIIVNFLSNTINNENDIDTKLLGIIENNKNEDIFDILKIKLEKNQAMVITSFEDTEKTTSAINGISKAFERNNQKVLLLDSKNVSSTSENELDKYDYVIVNAKNILEDAGSLMAVQQFKNTVLLVTERKTKLNLYKRAKETLKDVDANLLGSVLIR